jgi:hypothetical protein
VRDDVRARIVRGELRDLREPVEFRLYTYSLAADAPWHPATLHRSDGEELVLSGSFSTVGVPGQVQGVVAGAEPGGLRMTWLPAAGATSYTVSWSATPGGPILGSLQTDGTPSVVIPGLSGGNTYVVTVTGNNSFGSGPTSQPASGVAGGTTRYFFGTIATSPAGAFGLYVRPDRTAVFLAGLSGGGWIDAEDVMVSTDGSFAFTSAVDGAAVTGQVTGASVAGTIGGAGSFTGA